VRRKGFLLTASEVADYLRIHVMTVYRMVQRGDMPAIRVGKRWRFRREHIDQWLLKKGTVKSPTRATRSRR
jgi:excisionase family DNA binding protein